MRHDLGISAQGIRRRVIGRIVVLAVAIGLGLGFGTGSVRAGAAHEATAASWEQLPGPGDSVTSI